MKRINLKILTIVLAVVSGSSVYSEDIGKFALVIGSVQVKSESGSWSNAHVGLAITEKMQINTGMKASAVVALNNGTRLKIEQATMLSMDAYKEGNFGSAADVNLKQGRVTAFVNKIQGDQANLMRIRTPTMVAGVRGTIQEVSHDPERGSEVFLHESQAEVIGRSGHINQVPEKGELSDDGRGDVATPEDNKNKSESVAVTDQSMSKEERDVITLKEDPMFSTNAADVQMLIEATEHAAQEFGDFGITLPGAVPPSIQRL